MPARTSLRVLGGLLLALGAIGFFAEDSNHNTCNSTLGQLGQGFSTGLSHQCNVDRTALIMIPARRSTAPRIMPTAPRIHMELSTRLPMDPGDDDEESSRYPPPGNESLPPNGPA